MTTKSTPAPKKPRALLPSDVEFTVECLPEDMPIEGNASAIGPEEDAKINAWVYSQLDSGNGWAWCCVRVTARWGDFEGVDCLGGCSYKSEADFMGNEYLKDMKAEALANLNARIQAVAAKVYPLMCDENSNA